MEQQKKVIAQCIMKNFREVQIEKYVWRVVFIKGMFAKVLKI